MSNTKNIRITQIIERINRLVEETAEKADGDMSEFLHLWQNDMQDQLKDIVKNKKLKDPDAPKGACSAYIFFCRDKRAEVKEENPDMDSKDITRELGRQWKALSEKKKAKYTELSTKDKERFEKESKSYEPPSEEELKEKQKPKRKRASKKEKKERTGPKKPTTAFLYFSKDMRAKVKEDNPDMNGREITKELGRLWKEDYADEESRKKWIELYQKDKERFESEKSASEEEKSESESEKPKKKAKKEKKEKKSKKSKKDDDEEDVETEIEEDQ